MFQVTQAPVTVKALAGWAVRELTRLANYLITPQVRSVTFEVLHAEPPQMYPGMVVVADGSDWNPGSGAGMYRRNANNASWTFIG